MDDDMAWIMTAASIFSIGHHPKNYTDGECPMTARMAGSLADELMREYRARFPRKDDRKDDG